MGKGGGSDVDGLRQLLQNAVDQLCDQAAAKAPTILVQELNDSLRTELSSDISALASRVQETEAHLSNIVQKADVERMLADMKAQMNDDVRAVRAECADAVNRVIAIEGRLSECERLVMEHADVVPRILEHGERLERAEVGLGEQDTRSQEMLTTMEVLHAKASTSERRLESVETALDKLGASVVDVKNREAELNAELARAAVSAAASTPAPPPAPSPAPLSTSVATVALAESELPANLEEKLGMLDSLDTKMSLLGKLSSEIDQLHTVQREVRHELVLLKRDEGSLNNSLADTKQHLNRMQSTLEQLEDTVAADVTPFASRLQSLPTALEQIERKLQAMGEWQEGEKQSLVAQLNTKADKSLVAPVQKALIMIRDMLFDSGHRKCAAGRAQFRCLTCDKLQSELQGSLVHVPTGHLPARQPSPAAETIFKYGPVNRTARRADVVREAGLQAPRPPESTVARSVRRPGTAPAR